MPNDLPYDKWYWADWLAATVMLSPSTRGIWLDLLGAMYLMDQASSISGDITKLSCAGRCSPVQMETAIDELITYHVADVTDRDGIVTITCRRYKKREKERKRAREGMRKARAERAGYGDVTATRAYKSESESEKEIHKEKNLIPILAEKIRKLHPRVTKPIQTDAVIAKQLLEPPGDRTPEEFAAWLENRTRLYAECVSRWPAAEKRFIRGSCEWFSGGCYDEDETTWQRGGESSNGTVSVHEERDYN